MRLITFITLLMMAMLQALPAAAAVDWPMAPVACLPDRAERWDTESEMEPCHCPPQEMCPDKLELNTDDIKFRYQLFKTRNGGTPFYSNVIEADEVAKIANGDVDPAEVLGYTAVQVRDLLADAVMKKSGHNIVGGVNGGLTVFRTDIFVELGGGADLDDWTNNSLKLPIMLAQQCCDSICPAGTTPEITSVEVLKPRPLNEGVDLEAESAELIETQMEEFLEAVWDRIDLLEEHAEEPENDVEFEEIQTAIKKLESVFEDGECVQCYLGEIQGETSEICENTDVESEGMYCELAYEMDEHIDGTQEAVDYIREHDLLDLICETDEERAHFEELLNLVEGLQLAIEKEVVYCDKEPEYITIEQFSCSAAQEFTWPREGCLTKGTKITMADGSLKNIEEIVLGDKVMGNHGEAEVTAHSVFTQQTDRMYSINGGKAFFTVEHPVLTPKGWKSMDALITSTKSDAKVVGTLRVGDVILMAGGKKLNVTSIEEVVIEGGVSAYNLSVTGDGSFIANDFIMKSFKQMQMHYQESEIC